MIHGKVEKSDIHDIEDAQTRRTAAALRASRIAIFEFEPATEKAYWDDRLRELWGVSADVEITYNDVVIEGVHPDDRDYHTAATASALNPKGDGRLDITYRVLPLDGGPMRWIRAIADCKFADGVPVRLIGTVEDVTERTQAAERNKFLVGELQHRLKNTLAIVGAVIKRSTVGHEDVDSYSDALQARVKALSGSHDIIRKNNWEDVPFDQIVLSVVEDFASGEPRVTFMPGPQVIIPENNVLVVSLAVYELFSNSLKHGAMSRADGNVTVSTTADGGVAKIRWVEAGGPAMPGGEYPASGFGSYLIRRVLTEELDATVTYGDTDDGTVFELITDKLKMVGS